MKIRCDFELDVDEQAWADEYGISLEEVAEDVRTQARLAAVVQVQKIIGTGLRGVRA